MIHSLSGGILKEKKIFDFAKVEIIDDYYSGIYWYISKIKNLKEGDLVLVPFKDILKLKAKVLKIDKNVSEDASPVRIKNLKEILSIYK